MADDLRELIEGHLRGEPAATEALMERALTLALRTATAVLRDHERANDVAQDVGIEVLRRAGRLREPASFDAWVHRVSVRVTMRAIGRRTVDLDIDGVDLQAVGSATDAMADREAIRSAVAQLPERQQIAIALRYVHGLTSDEIADALGCRAGTVDSLLSRARAMLRSSPALSDFALGGDAQ
jgi:RNA polymerase sigma-70 factor (ECF subfamily)